MAYGCASNAPRTQVVKEAEHIMYHERGRFVPPKQAIFCDKYTDEERAVYADTGAVGMYWPRFLPFGRSGKGE